MMKQRTLGYSVWGRPIVCLESGTGQKKVLFCAAFHGSEWITARILWRFLVEYGKRQDWQEAARLWAVPCVNPDGVILSMERLPAWSPQYIIARAIAEDDPGFPRTWKANGRGVDLNLNYPAGWERAVVNKGLLTPSPRNWPGPCPLSEPESRLMAELAEEVRPDVLVTLHAQGEEIYWEYGGIRPDGGAALGREMERRSGYRLTEVPPESAYAGYKDWFIDRFRKPGFTVECGLGENPLPLCQLDEICDRVFPILETALAFDFP